MLALSVKLKEEIERVAGGTPSKSSSIIFTELYRHYVYQSVLKIGQHQLKVLSVRCVDHRFQHDVHFLFFSFRCCAGRSAGRFFLAQQTAGLQLYYDNLTMRRRERCAREIARERGTNTTLSRRRHATRLTTRWSRDSAWRIARFIESKTLRPGDSQSRHRLRTSFSAHTARYEEEKEGKKGEMMIIAPWRICSPYATNVSWSMRLEIVFSIFNSRLVFFHSICLVSSKSFDMVDGRARLIEPAKREGKLGVEFPGSPFQRPIPADGNYWVLDTDYINYSIVWSCEFFNGKSFSKSSANRQHIQHIGQRHRAITILIFSLFSFPFLDHDRVD